MRRHTTGPLSKVECVSEEEQKGHRDTPERRGVDYAAV